MSTTCQTNDSPYSYTISNVTINSGVYSTDSSGNTSVTLNISITYNNSSTDTPNSAYLVILPDLTNCLFTYSTSQIDVDSGTYTNPSVIFDYDATQNSTLYLYINGDDPGDSYTSYMEDGDYVSVALSYANDIITYTVTYATTTSTTGTTTTSLTVSQAPVIQS